MSAFHPFLRLPLELRQLIWKLSMEPREVAAGRYLTDRPRSPPPPLLHTCAESRKHLHKYYVKAFAMGTPSKYILVNFNLDTICISQYSLEHELDAELDLIRWLVIEATSSGKFFRKHYSALIAAKALETVTIIHLNSPDDEYRDWDHILERYYYRDNPVRFYTKVLFPNDRTDKSNELNRDNYLAVECARRRKALAERSERYASVYTISDTDDDVDAPGSWGRVWIHAATVPRNAPREASSPPGLTREHRR